MTIGIARRRGRRRWAIVVAVVGGLTLLTAAVAQANLTGSAFEGSDGNLVVNTAGNTDWANVAGLNSGIDKPTGKTDNAFGQGTKEDNAAVTVVTGSIPPNKNDLTRFYEASEQASNGHIYLYLAWERLVNIGNANLDFEINQKSTSGFTADATGAVTLNRTAGDLLVTYDFGGSGTPTLGLNTWLTAANGDSVSDCYSANALPCWGKHVDLSAAGHAEGAVNTAAIAEPFAGGTLGTGLFGEAAVDLTDAGVFQEGVCEAFGSTFVKSRSSSSFTAELKDFIAPVGVNISNCGTINVHKTTENGDSSFGYTTTGTGLSSFSLSNGGTKTFSNLSAGSFSVTENLTSAQTTAGWTLKSLSCTSTNGDSTFTYDPASQANITLALGDTVDCYYTNHTNLNPTTTTQVKNASGNTNVSDGASVPLGTTVYDTAALTGGTSGAGGTVTYYYQLQTGADTTPNCTAGTSLGAKTVTNAAVPNSNSKQFTSPGTYEFWASYSGDGNNNGSASTCGAETVVVPKASPSFSTQASPTGSLTVGTGYTVGDTATMSGGYSPSGTVTFALYSDDTCTTAVSGVAGSGTIGAVDAGKASYSVAWTPTKVGTYYWKVEYLGDDNNNGSGPICGGANETLTVAPATPGGTTTPAAQIRDTFTISGGYNPAGTVDFKLYTDAACTGTVYNSDLGVALTSGSATSKWMSAPAATYYWQVTFHSSDTNNSDYTSPCGETTGISLP